MEIQSKFFMTNQPSSEVTKLKFFLLGEGGFFILFISKVEKTNSKKYSADIWGQIMRKQ
jgi:hypothetical protein